MTSVQRPSLDDVLNAFAVEEDSTGQTLASYLKRFPEYAEDLVDLSREIHRTVLEEGSELSTQDRARIEAAWQQHVKARAVVVVDPLVALSVAQIGEVTAALQLPRQVLAAFREHRVIVSSIPRRFFVRLAAEVQASVEQLREVLSTPVTLSPARNYKANSKPEEGGPVTFEQLLIDAGISDEKRAILMAEDE